MASAIPSANLSQAVAPADWTAAGWASALDRSASPGDRLRALRAAVPGRIVLTTSFGIEDQVLTHLVATNGLDVAFATLDTGRLFPETYRLWAETERRYRVRIHAYRPDTAALARLIALDGTDGFRQSRQARLDCCHVRKVEPLRRSLAGAAAWVTGLRADQSGERQGVTLDAWDADHGLRKVAPLFDWSRDRVADFAAEERVPVNPLHARGFPSIGCVPCTRAVSPGEPERAGRWWWEDDAVRECGLHLGPDGRLVRKAVA